MALETSTAEAPASANSGALTNTPSNETTSLAPKPEIPRAEQVEKAIDADLMKVWAKHNPPRDPNTKQFTPRDPAAAALETPDAKPDAVKAADGMAADTKPAGQPEDVKGEPVAAKPSAIDPPHSWSAAEKAKWASVPLDLQTYIAKRETEAHQAITRSGEQVKAYERWSEPFIRVIDAHKDHFAKHGITPDQAFSHLIDIQRRYEVDPAGVVNELARQANLQPANADQQQQGETHPIVAQLRSEIAAVRAEQARDRQELAAYRNRQTQRDQAEEKAQIADIAKTISDFAKGKPYFDDTDVREDMAALLQTGRAQGLDDAYDKAIYANKSIRERIQTDQRKTDDDKRKADEKTKADAARKADTVNVKSDPATKSSPKTIDDTLRAEALRLYGRDR